MQSQGIQNTLLVKKTGAVATLSLNRPPANSYDHGYLQRLSTTLLELSQEKSIKVMLINSTSPKFFCAGADIKTFSNNSPEQNTEMVKAARAVSEAITQSGKIVIAAVRGHVLGGGLEMIMACDLRLAAHGTYLVGLPEVKLGLMPGNGGTPRLIDLIGASRATELLLTGNPISPEKAYHFGLFHQLYAQDTFDEEVERYVAQVAGGAGQAMSTIKKYLQQHKGCSRQEALDLETASVNTLYGTPDAKEGFLAFVEKRPPQFGD